MLSSIGAAESTSDNAVLTIATGKPLYVRFAINLARSFMFWNQKSNIRFWIATDQPCALDRSLTGVGVIRLKPGELRKGFSSKLYLDILAPAPHTLFVDADCLCVGPLDSVFQRFKGRPVGVVGASIRDGEWFGDIGALLRRFHLSEMPKFNGGVYYIERGQIATRVYDLARQLETAYDELGLVRLRGLPNEELPVALAMALNGLGPLQDDGTVMGDLFACAGDLEIDVLRGHSRLVNPPPSDPKHRSWYPFHVITPLIVHFLGDHTNNWRYRAEEKKLTVAMRWNCPSIVADRLVNLGFSFPHSRIEAARDLLRPLYHRVFGPRRVKVSERIVT